MTKKGRTIVYKKITTEEAAAFANQLAKVNHMGYATAVIDEHWEADFMFPVSDGKNTGTLRIYERLDDSLGFLVSTRVEITRDPEEIGDFLLKHINTCIDEWVENGFEAAATGS
mgnify:CR=1 FL=1